MAQSAEDILRLQLGNLMLQLAMKESEVQALREQLEEKKNVNEEK